MWAVRNERGEDVFLEFESLHQARRGRTHSSFLNRRVDRGTAIRDARETPALNIGTGPVLSPDPFEPDDLAPAAHRYGAALGPLAPELLDLRPVERLLLDESTSFGEST